MAASFLLAPPDKPGRAVDEVTLSVLVGGARGHRPLGRSRG
jgi:hypothetical protein